MNASLTLTISSPSLGQTFDVVLTEGQPRVVLGRAAQCDVQIPLPIISSQHICLELRGAGRWEASDLHSTNGTMLDGARMEPGQFVALRDGATLSVLDVALHVKLGGQVQQAESFTLAESSTLVRQMVNNALIHAKEEDAVAYIEVAAGPDRGRRYTLADQIQAAFIGAAPGALIRLRSPSAPAEALRIERRGDGFAASIAAPNVSALINGETMRAGASHTLSTRDRVSLYGIDALFVDPLEEYLQELEGVGHEPSTEEQTPDEDKPQVPAPEPDAVPPPEPKTPLPAEQAHPELGGAPTAPEPSAPERSAARRGWRPAEIALLGGILVVVAACVGLMLVLFEVLSL